MSRQDDSTQLEGPASKMQHMGVELTSGEPPAPANADFINSAQMKALGDHLSRENNAQDTD